MSSSKSNKNVGLEVSSYLGNVLMTLPNTPPTPIPLVIPTDSESYLPDNEAEANVYRAIRTTLEMLAQRGAKLVELDPDTLHAIAIPCNPQDPLIHIYWIPNEKLVIRLAKQFYYEWKTYDVRHAIIVYQKTITPSVRQIFLTLLHVRVELFPFSEMQWNRTRHILVPLHRRVSGEHHPEHAKYPVMKHEDAIARFLGFRTGEIIEIQRHDGTIAYRVIK